VVRNLNFEFYGTKLGSNENDIQTPLFPEKFQKLLDALLFQNLK